MEKSRLKNKANKSKQPTDIASYKKQRNLVISLNRQSKLISIPFAIQRMQNPSGNNANHISLISMQWEILR